MFTSGTASPGPSPSGRARPSVSTMCNEAGREKMAGRMKWMPLAAGAVMVGAAAFAAQGGFVGNGGGEARPMVQLDRKSVVSGKSVSVRVDLGGRRIMKTKNEKQ